MGDLPLKLNYFNWGERVKTTNQKSEKLKGQNKII
jgi:hypothetical protein